jgi:hypothetical protein
MKLITVYSENHMDLISTLCGKVKRFLVLNQAGPPIRWVLPSYRENKAAAAWSQPLTFV